MVQKPKKTTEATVTGVRRPTTDGVVSKLYNPLDVPLLQLDLSHQLCPYMDSVPPATRPQFSQLWNASAAVDIDTVECVFGAVPKGCVLSYQQPKICTVSDDRIVVPDAPDPPKFTLPDLSSHLQPFMPLPSDVAYNFFSMEITLEQSHEYEMATRKQSDCDHWHKLRKNRITASTFKRVCSRKANHDTLASALLTTRSVKSRKELKSTGPEVVL